MKDNLQFLCDLSVYQDEQPFELYGFPEQQSDTRTNCKFESRDVEVTDARLLDDITIASYGFAFVKHKSACPLEADHFETVGGDKTVLMQYLEETIGLVKDMFTPVDVICFDWRVSKTFQFSKQRMEFLGATKLMEMVVPPTRSQSERAHSAPCSKGHQEFRPSDWRRSPLR